MTRGRSSASMAESKGLSSSASSPLSSAPFASRASARPFRGPGPSLSSPAIVAGALPWVASMSIASRSAIEPARIASRQAITARMVSGLSPRPSSMVRRPASMRLASATSPSRVRSVLRPISRRYIPTGSPGSPISSAPTLDAVAAEAASGRPSSTPVSASSPSVTEMPNSDSSVIASSIRSALVSPGGRAPFSSSWVT